MTLKEALTVIIENDDCIDRDSCSGCSLDSDTCCDKFYIAVKIVRDYLNIGG